MQVVIHHVRDADQHLELFDLGKITPSLNFDHNVLGPLVHKRLYIFCQTN